MKTLKKMMCRIFGHSPMRIREVYAIPVYRKSKPTRYIVVEETRCSRCGELVKRKEISREMSRSEMLREGWFIEG